MAFGRAQAAGSDVITVDTIAPGVVHSTILRASGPFHVQVIAVDLRSGRYLVTSARAHDSLRGRERPSDIVRRMQARGVDVVAAINADFFDLRGDGANENNHMLGSQVLKGVPVTDSPFDTFRNAHTQFAMTTSGRPLMDRFVYAGVIEQRWGALCRVRLHCQERRFALDGVNGIPRVDDALVLFTDAWGRAPHVDTTRLKHSTGFAAVRVRRVGRRWVAAERPRDTDTVATGNNEGMLIAYGSAARARLDSLTQHGASFVIHDAFRPNDGPIGMIVGGWPRIVRDGIVIAASVDSVEGTFPRFSATRHPRSGVGFSRDSTTLYLVTVDGRQESSDGMSLVEFGEEMRRDGVWQGLNLDGGGSTTLVVGDHVANKPSDASGERAVGNVILVVRR